MIFTAICALFAFCSGDRHLEFHEDLPDPFYKFLKILMVLMVLCVGRFIYVMGLTKRRNMAMRKSWEGKAKKFVLGSKPWDLY